MNITSLTYNKTFSNFLKQALQGNTGTRLCQTFGRFAEQMDQETPAFVIVDASYLRAAPDEEIWSRLERTKVPMLIVDDFVGQLSDEIEAGRYPANTAGVIFNEVFTQPAILKQVLDHVGKAIKHAVPGEIPNVQAGIHKILGQYDWVMDPDFANQYRLNFAA